MHEVSAVDIGEFYQTRELFKHPNEVKPMNLANDETTPYENYQENGATPPLVTKPSSPKSPPSYASDA